MFKFDFRMDASHAHGIIPITEEDDPVHLIPIITEEHLNAPFVRNKSLHEETIEEDTHPAPRTLKKKSIKSKLHPPSFTAFVTRFVVLWIGILLYASLGTLLLYWMVNEGGSLHKFLVGMKEQFQKGIPLACVAAYFGVMNFNKLLVMIGQLMLSNGYDNSDPRKQRENLKGWPRRALSSYQSANEMFGPFAVGVLMASILGVPYIIISKLSIAFVALRMFHGLVYLLDMHPVRDVIWWSSLFAVISMYFSIWNSNLFELSPQAFVYRLFEQFLDILIPNKH